MNHPMIKSAGLLLVVVLAGGALWAHAGDLNPPPGPIGPTMRTLDEIYGAAATPQSCPPCTWDYWQGLVSAGQEVLAVPGSGILHAIFIAAFIESYVNVYNGPPGDNDKIGEFLTLEGAELDVEFHNGLHLVGVSSEVTVLYRSYDP